MQEEPAEGRDAARDPTLETALLILRLGLAVLFVVWGLNKLVNPEQARAILETFYGRDPATISSNATTALGLAELAIAAMLLFGMAKDFTYAAVLAMHIATTLVSLTMHLAPFTMPNLFFWANWPILGALVALYLLRRRDRLFSFGG